MDNTYVFLRVFIKQMNSAISCFLKSIDNIVTEQSEHYQRPTNKNIKTSKISK